MKLWPNLKVNTLHRQLSQWTVFCRCLSDSLIILTQSGDLGAIKFHILWQIQTTKRECKQSSKQSMGVLKWAGRVLKNRKGIVIIIALLATFIFFNPLFFVPYTLLAPRKAAEKSV